MDKQLADRIDSDISRNRLQRGWSNIYILRRASTKLALSCMRFITTELDVLSPSSALIEWTSKTRGSFHVALPFQSGDETHGWAAGVGSIGVVYLYTPI
jgi:hypothetical protein